MTTTQMNTISSPATGLELFNTTVGIKYVYNGSAWVGEGNLKGTYSTTGTATTTFTVTIGVTMPNTNYVVNPQANNTLSAALMYVTNKTTTTFDVTYLAGLTGSVSFDYTITP